MITGVKLTTVGDAFLVTLDDGTVLGVPDVGSRHRREAQAWFDAGNTRLPADPEPSLPTDAERVDREIGDSKAFLGLIRVLAKRFNLTEQQLRDAIKAEL